MIYKFPLTTLTLPGMSEFNESHIGLPIFLDDNTGLVTLDGSDEKLQIGYVEGINDSGQAYLTLDGVRKS